MVIEQAAPHVQTERYAVTSLHVQSFRNYRFASLETNGQSVVLTGHNGAGKTNILEALSLLVPGRGMRMAQVAELDCANVKAPWVVSAHIDRAGDSMHLGTGRDAEAETERRMVKCDGEKLSSQNALASLMAVVWLTPQMDSLFRDSAGTRRRFIDRLVHSFDAEHATHVNQYERTMRERNKLLSQYGYDTGWVHVLEQQLAGLAVAVACGRNMMLDRLNQTIANADHPFPKALLSMQGAVEALLQEGLAASEVEEYVAQKLAENRPQDSHAGRTLYGTHRSDLQVIHAPKQMDASLCSTGEQKAMLLSIILAHAHARSQWEGCAPIILLDEVVAHLDVKRRGALFDALESLGVQCWMTGTDAADFSQLGERAMKVHVEDGQLRQA